MKPWPALGGWFVTGLAIAAGLLAWTNTGPRRPVDGCVLFSASQRGCAIVIPHAARPAERQAAELLQATLTRASGHDPACFPILAEGTSAAEPAVFIGATERFGSFLGSSPAPPFDTGVGRSVQKGTVGLRAERRDLIVGAVAWFLEKNLGVHWFMPGPLGESVPTRTEVTLAAGDEIDRPGFVSRALSGLDAGGGEAWCAQNKLDSRLQHGLCFDRIFRPEDFRRRPEMAPVLNGRRYVPTAPRDYNWQPDLLQPATIDHAVGVIERAFADSEVGASFSLCVNDSIRYDESPAARTAIGPLRFFRGRPDYSDYVFRFTNAVASEVAKKYPDRWIGAYAYYWAENTPRFPVAPNVIPFLTADRSQWFEPGFAAEDKRLIERWCRSGAGLVGVYDYFEGAAYLVPRPTLYAVRESIPFEFRAGVRAFYGEAHSNWALDGPKPWLAAQLLWAPQRSPDELLDQYYREFWGEAAAPMRAFFARCERAWLEQPLPGYWIKYYGDDDQVRLFDGRCRRELRSKLTEAATLATTDAVRARLAFVAAGFAVTERFGEFCEAREQLSRRAAVANAPPASLIQGWGPYLDAKDRLIAQHAAVRAESELAIATPKLDGFLRNDPSMRVVHRLLESEEGRILLAGTVDLTRRALGVSPMELGRLFGLGKEHLADTGWTTVIPRDVERTVVRDWTPSDSPWRGHGESCETRSVRRPVAPGSPSVRFAGSRSESLEQWVARDGDIWYVGQVRVRAKVSPGNETFLILSFLDEKQQYIGIGYVDRLPPGDWSEGLRLFVAARAPAQARWVGLSMRVSKQVNDDFVEFSQASLKGFPVGLGDPVAPQASP